MAYGKNKAKEQDEKNKLEDSVYNALSDDFIPSSAVALNQQIAQTQGGEGNQDLKGLFSENNNLKPFSLSPDMSIAGLMLTEILVADGKNQKVRVKIMQDVYDSNSGNIIVSKGSIAIGRTSSFDADTGLMNISLNTVVKDGKSLDISLSVSSADMTESLKGQIYDARGKHLFGTFVASFTAGALGALSQTYISPLQDSAVIGDTLTGAALQGAAEVGQRIADTYAGDLQNAPRIFFAPAGVKVVLHPNE